VTGARVTALDDEDLIAAVRRSLQDLVLPRLQEAGAEEFLISEMKSCLSMLDFAARGLATRQAERVDSEGRLAALFAGRPAQSAWQGIDANSTGVFLARARRASPGLSPEDLALAVKVRELLRARLRVEVQTRLQGK
jgi:hypothetical protein